MSQFRNMSLGPAHWIALSYVVLSILQSKVKLLVKILPIVCQRDPGTKMKCLSIPILLWDTLINWIEVIVWKNIWREHAHILYLNITSNKTSFFIVDIFFLFIKIKNNESMENYKEGKSEETMKRNFTSSANFGYMLMNIFLGNQIVII